MIYCNIKGGLGNILFQLATGISFAIEQNTKFSVSNYDWHIQYLNSEKERNPILNHAEEYSFYFRKLQTKKHPDNILQIQYPFTYFEDINLNYNCLIDGYFQSEKYFKKNRAAILKQFNLPLNKQIKTYLKYPFLFKKRTTSIHIRRGEYLTSPIHFNQTMEYYYNSMEILKSKTDLFVIFSDDIEWCKNQFKNGNFIFIEREKDYIEIFLMSKCSNNIICNSSFSWWGAWLNKNKSKTVIAPKQWFKTTEPSTIDLIPENWIILE
jgi:hypothetical protein